MHLSVIPFSYQELFLHCTFTSKIVFLRLFNIWGYSKRKFEYDYKGLKEVFSMGQNVEIPVPVPLPFFRLTEISLCLQTIRQKLTRKIRHKEQLQMFCRLLSTSNSQRQIQLLLYFFYSSFLKFLPAD